MHRAPVAALGLVLPILASGCLGASGRSAPDDPDALPPGWDESSPPRSALAAQPSYDLTHSTSFVLKGHTYGRFVVRVPERLENVQVFFTTGTRGQGSGPHPTLDDPDIYHYEFMQIRPLGRLVKSVDVDATTHFSHAQAKGVFTLTYLYGRNANHQFLAPYEGVPDRWAFEPGYYDFVVATDEALTVGINVRTGSAYWTTFYHPQELGASRAEALGFYGVSHDNFGGRLPDEDRELRGVVQAAPGERLNYFTFADVWYDASTLSVGATGTAAVTINGETVPHRLAIQSPGPGRAEAYAFAMGFNEAGPGRVDLTASAHFHEELSARSNLIVLLFVFGVATIPVLTLEGIPTTAEL